MKKTFPAFITILALLFFTQCQNKTKSKLVGIWQLQLLQANGTDIRGNALGNWLWEFNSAGGFLTDIAGMREKGIYELKGNRLTLKHINNNGRPDQSYTIAVLDSVQLYIVAIDSVNKTTMRFAKRKVEEVAGKEKD